MIQHRDEIERVDREATVIERVRPMPCDSCAVGTLALRERGAHQFQLRFAQLKMQIRDEAALARKPLKRLARQRAWRAFTVGSRF